MKWSNSGKLIGTALHISYALNSCELGGKDTSIPPGHFAHGESFLGKAPGFWKDYHVVNIKSYARQASHCFQLLGSRGPSSFPPCHRGIGCGGPPARPAIFMQLTGRVNRLSASPTGQLFWIHRKVKEIVLWNSVWVPWYNSASQGGLWNIQ